MHPPLRVRRANVDDIPALVALVNAAYRGDSSRVGWTTEADLLGGQRIDAERLSDSIAAPHNVVLVYEPEGHVVGCVHLQQTDTGCYLGMLTIRPDMQAGGLGRRLLHAAERWAQTQWGVQSVYMTVIIQRTELIAWYERRGYLRTGEFEPFPYDDARFGLPQRDDLQFEILKKTLQPA